MKRVRLEGRLLERFIRHREFHSKRHNEIMKVLLEHGVNFKLSHHLAMKLYGK